MVKKAFFEALFVVLGVILALAGNAWREGRANDRRAAVAMTSIAEEIRVNKEAVADALSYHQSQLEELRGPHPADWRPQPSLFSRGFIYVAPVYGDAWRAASSSGLFEHLPYETLLVLSRVYSQQALYERQGQNVFPLIYEQLYSDGPDAIFENHTGLSSMISTFTYRETRLVEEYERVLQQLESSG